MRLTRLQLAHQPAVKPLQGMMRASDPWATTGKATVRTIDAFPSGVLVEDLEGTRWWVTAVGWGELAPGEHPSPQPPPMPIAQKQPKGNR